MWALLWKYGGLALHLDTLLGPGLRARQSHQSFLALNSHKNRTLLNLMSFVDRHDDIPSRVLQRLMNRAVARKNTLVAKEQQNLLRVSVNGISVKVALDDIDGKAWTEEVERECGETLAKVS